jgi:hypothetical protein
MLDVVRPPRRLARVLALSWLIVIAACGAEPPERAAEADDAPCAHGVYGGEEVLHFEYLACGTDADCLVVQWGDECENTTTYGQRHARCVALSPVCPLDGSSDGPHEARCNADGRCELVLF